MNSEGEVKAKFPLALKIFSVFLNNFVKKNNETVVTTHVTSPFLKIRFFEIGKFPEKNVT